ncbi:hypothetical protein I7I53_03965 [Histoplasma capsulatum var. duboisii H88]|nr:hypothetical protein I7I53_03965 [Histoplasma capsulatum var. duboisii H88]
MRLLLDPSVSTTTYSYKRVANLKSECNKLLVLKRIYPSHTISSYINTFQRGQTL